MNDSLMHYGVPGMRWGKRRGSSASDKTSKPQEKNSDDFTKAVTIRTRAKTGGTKVLSNNDLQTAITRMNLEQSYTRLSPSVASKGQKLVQDVLLNPIKQVGSQLVGSLLKDVLVSKLGLGKNK